MTKTLVERMGEAVRGFADQTTQIVASHDALRENVIGSLDKLRESNTLFKGLLVNVTETLEPLESNVAKRVAGLQSAMENTVSSTRTTVDWIDNQMHELRNISGGVLRDLSALTQRFEGQGRYIATVAETLAETHGRIDQSLVDRRDALEQIINMLADRTAAIEENFGSRSQQIGERLAAFNRLLQELLQAAEARAHEIARHVANSTNQITLTINKQHETIRNAYSEERGRTATALKSTYEESMDEMKQMFTELQERFTDTAREVREVAQEVQGSLEQTRIELKRGVLELPHETRESAEAMRRVVADQLKALSELNEIVSRHARDIEVVEPARAEQAGARYAGQEVQRAAAPRGEPIEFRRPRQAEQRRAPPREVPARERDEGDRGGWLTDLLVRSKGDEEEERGNGSSLQGIESLELALCRHRAHDRSRRGGGAMGPSPARRAQRVHPPSLHGAGAEDLRRDPPPLPQERRLPRDGRPLHRRVRATARTGIARRPRPGAVEDVPHLRHRQGLHAARARVWAIELTRSVIPDGAKR